MTKKSFSRIFFLIFKRGGGRQESSSSRQTPFASKGSREPVHLLPPRSEGEDSRAPGTAGLPAKHRSGCWDQLSCGRPAWRPSALPLVWSHQHHPSSSPPPPAAPSGSSSAGAEPRSILGSAASARGGIAGRRSGGLWHPSAASPPCRQLYPAPFRGAADKPLPGDLQHRGVLAGAGCSEAGRPLDF